MRVGGFRVVVATALSAGLAALALTGCSAAGDTLAGTNGQAVAIGQEAIGFTSSGGASAGWTSPISCPDGFEEGLRSTTPTGDTLTELVPASVTGPLADPNLLTGYVATCVYQTASTTVSVLEFAFFDMDSAHEDTITSRLATDGFTTTGPTQSNDAAGHTITQTIYSNGRSRVVVATVTIGTTPAFLVAG